MSERLQKSRKISKRKDIVSILKGGRKWQCASMEIIYKNSKYCCSRIGILVSRKNGNAVVRNRIKRRIREIFRRCRKYEPPFYDILIKPQESENSNNFKSPELKKKLMEWEIWERKQFPLS